MELPSTRKRANFMAAPCAWSGSVLASIPDLSSFPPIGTRALRARLRSHDPTGVEIMNLEFRVQYRPRRCVLRIAFLRAQAVCPHVLPKRIQRGEPHLRRVFHVVEGVSHPCAFLPGGDEL